MVPLQLPESSSPLVVLCLGAHSDDIEIGCGGAVRRLISEREVIVHWVVFACSGERTDEAVRSAECLLQGAREKHVHTHEFRDAFFPYVGAELKDVFEQLKRTVSPDVVFTHTRHDLHQDHRAVNELTWNTYRDHLILEYEIPKFDGDLGSPNLFVALDRAGVDLKIRHLMQFFGTQRSKRWFDEETFRGLMRLRGVEAGAQYAEGFYCRKLLF